MDPAAILTGQATQIGWRQQLALILLFLAAVPLQVFAVPGFEVTPSLLLSPLAVLLFSRTDKVHWAVAAFIGLCGALALVGMTGIGGHLRNFLGAASYSHGALYILVGMSLFESIRALSQLWRALVPVAIVMTAMFAIDAFITRGNLVQSSAYTSVSYRSKETVFVSSVFPFYGKFAVISLATVAMMIGGLAVAAYETYASKLRRYGVLVIATGLVFVAFSMWSRQVQIGVIVFYLALVGLSFRHRGTWISIAVFLTFVIPWGIMVPHVTPWEGAPRVTTNEIGANKISRDIEDVLSGNLNDLSTGRIQIYKEAISQITPRIAFIGCGFCDLIDVMKFPFSSLHNVILTAVYKGGIFYGIIYLCSAFSSLIFLRSGEKSFARDVTISVVISILVQSMFYDIVYLQVVPALLFTVTGFAWAARRQRKTDRPLSQLSNAALAAPDEREAADFEAPKL